MYLQKTLIKRKKIKNKRWKGNGEGEGGFEERDLLVIGGNFGSHKIT